MTKQEYLVKGFDVEMATLLAKIDDEYVPDWDESDEVRFAPEKIAREQVEGDTHWENASA